MNPSAAKAKGRRCAQEAKALILAIFPQLEDGDIVVTSSGTSGEDLQLSPAARRCFPFSVECKNMEKIKIWEAIKQAESHAEDNESAPLVIFKRNHSDLMACLPLTALLYFLMPTTNEKPCPDKQIQ